MSRATALAMPRLRPLLVGLLLLALLVVQNFAVHRGALHAFQLHKHYSHHHVVAEFAERNDLATPPAAVEIPTFTVAFETPVKVLASAVENTPVLHTLPRAPPASA